MRNYLIAFLLLLSVRASGQGPLRLMIGSSATSTTSTGWSYSDAATIATGFHHPSTLTTGKELLIEPGSGTADGTTPVTFSNIYIRFASTTPGHDIVQTYVFYQGEGGYYGGNNGALNWGPQYLVPSSAGIKDSLNIAHYLGEGSGDETNPVLVQTDTTAFYSYTGGNHGFEDVFLTFGSATALTHNDDGSLWQDAAGHRLYIAHVYTSTQIDCISENTSATESNGGIAITKAQYIGSTLTHVSGAQHTGSLTGYTTSTPGMHGLTNGPMGIHFVVNGDTLSMWQSSHVYNFTSLQITQHNISYWPWSVIAYFNANRPGGGYTTWPNIGGVDWHTDDMVFDYTDSNGKATIYEKHTFNLPTTVVHCGLQQQAAFPIPAADSINRFFSGLNIMNDGANNYDYRIGVDIKTRIFNAQMFTTPSDWEGPPVTRLFDVIHGRVDGQAINLIGNFGFVPLFSGSDDSTIANNDRTIWVQAGSPGVSLGKVSLMVFANWTTPRLFGAGSSVKGVIFRGFVRTPTDGSNNEYVGKVYGNTYVWKDFLATGSAYTLTIPATKTLVDLHKRSNVSLSGQTGNINFTISSGSPQYGYYTGRY